MLKHLRKLTISSKSIEKSHFPPLNFHNILRGTNKVLSRNVSISYLVQNFTSFLVDPLILAVSLILCSKNGDKVDPFEIFTSEKSDF